jgi:hypothetical protein
LDMQVVAKTGSCPGLSPSSHCLCFPTC